MSFVKSICRRTPCNLRPFPCTDHQQKFGSIRFAAGIRTIHTVLEINEVRFQNEIHDFR